MLTNSDPNWPALKRQREAREQAVERFRRTWVPPEPGWESPRQHTDPRADVAGFVADALELGVALLCLEPEDQEQLAIGIEFFLRERAR